MSAPKEFQPFVPKEHRAEESRAASVTPLRYHETVLEVGAKVRGLHGSVHPQPRIGTMYCVLRSVYYIRVFSELGGSLQKCNCVYSISWDQTA